MSNFFKSSVVKIDSENIDIVSHSEIDKPIEDKKEPGADLGPSSVYEKSDVDMQAMYIEKGNSLINEAKEKSIAMLEEARQQAAQMVAEARQQAGAIAQRAYEEGMMQVEGDSRETIAKAEAVLLEALEQKEGLMAVWEKEMIDLSVEIARKVIGNAIELDSSALTRIYRYAVDRIKAENDQIRLKLGPGNFNTIIPDELGVEVVVDRNAGDHDIIAETENGEVNISIDSQINQIQRGFRMLMGEL